MTQIMTLLTGTLKARKNVLVKLNVGEDDLNSVIATIPFMKAPTISKLFGDVGYAVEAVVARSQINTLIPALKDAGATDILEIPLSKIVP
jgi:ATP phosphoribosyltransferase